MSTLLKLCISCLCISWFFLKIIKAQLGIELTTLVTEVQTYYLSSGVCYVYDKHHYDFANEKLLLDMIKRHSRQYSMSQAITYEDLSQLRPRRENALYPLVIRDMENLRLAINATKNVDMSQHPWLLLSIRESDFDCDNPGENFFKLKMNTKMLAKCIRNKILKRYYSIFENRTEIVDLAEWTPEWKFKLKNPKSLMDIHTDMKGITLKLAERKEVIQKTNEDLALFLDQLMSELEIFGNFTTTTACRSQNTGHYDKKSNQWSGLIEQVHSNKADIGLFLFTMSNKRQTAVDFAIPLARARYYLYAKLPDSKKVLWGAYFKAFDMYTWLVIGSSIMIISVLLSLIKNTCQGHFVQNTFENVINVWGIHCQQGIADRPTNTAIRIIYFSLLISSVVLNAIFSATITSYITVLSPKLPFDTYEDFKRDHSYKVTTLKGSHEEDLIRYDDPYLSPLRSRLKISCELPFDPYEGFKQACEPNTAFYSDEVTMDGIKYGPPCSLGQIDIGRFEYMSFILTKNSPYTKTISYFISRLREHGIVRRLKNSYFYKYTELPDNQPNIITFEETLPILTVWITGVMAALIVWFLELIMFYLFCFYRYE